MDELFAHVEPSAGHAHTGERLSQGHNLQTRLEHFHRYYLARHLAKGLDVLDCASGEGYGSALLAQVARSVVGVDLDPEAAAHAQRTYGRDGLEFRQGSATAMPVADGSVDLLVSFETLEHFIDHDAFFREARRVLRPGGRLVVSTPDREVYSPPGSEPNPFHARELTREEFASVVARFFPRAAFFAQRLLVGSAILPDPGLDGRGTMDASGGRAGDLVFERHGDGEVKASDGLTGAPYLICVASVDASAPPLPASLLVETSDVAGFTDALPWLRRELEERTAIQEQASRDAAAAREEAVWKVARAENRIARLEDDAAWDAHDLQELRAEREALRRKAAEDAVEVNRLREETLEQHGQAALTRDAHARLAAEADSLRRELALRTAQLDGVLGSTSWRLLDPARRAARLSPTLARLGKRGLNVARLGATGRLRERLALRATRAAEMTLIAGSGLFDKDWYHAAYPDTAGTDPVGHYVWVGAAAGYDPHPLFAGAWYLAQHPDVAASGTNPLAHYLRQGAAAGYDPHPLFDTAYYLAQAPEAATAEGGTVPLLHYLRRGRDDLRTPAPFFDPAGYYYEYPDARGSGMDPLAHYARHGAPAGYDPHPLFDTRHYLAACPEAAGSTLTPLGHFLRDGRQRGIRPSPLLGPDEPLDVARALAFPPVEPSASGGPDVTIVVPAYGHLYNTARCLHAVMRRSGTGQVRKEVLVMDDKPTEPIAPLLPSGGGLRVAVNQHNLGFVRSCNAASRLAKGRHLLFLNNDTIVHEGWLAPLVSLLDGDPTVGMAGCKLLNPDGTVQEAGGSILSDGWGRPYGAGDDPALPQYNFVRQVDCVIGACFIVPRRLFREVGGFDERYAPAFYEEFDLAFTLRAAGYRVMYQPASEVTHLDSSSYGEAVRNAQSSKNHKLFCRKWARLLSGQPAPSAAPFVARERPASAGTLLMIEDQVPEHDKHAGGQATLQYLGLLRELGFKVILAPFDGRAPQPYTAALEQQGIEVLHAPVQLRTWLRENGRHLDHVWTARPDVTDAYLTDVLRHTGAQITYLTHDLHYLREERRYQVDRDPQALAEARRYKETELRIFGTADRVLTFSEDEADVIGREAPGTAVAAIPLFFYGSGEKGKAVRGAARPDPARTDLLFVGGFRHVPNVDAATWMAQEIMPHVWRALPGARLRLIGSHAPPEVLALAGPQVEVSGHVPDLTQAYAQARISANPLRFGAGVKGKIVNSLAAGLPVVTTAVGNEGIRLRDGAEVLLGDTAERFAEQVVRLCQDDALWQALSDAGFAVIERRFSEAHARDVVSHALGLGAGATTREETREGVPQ